MHGALGGDERAKNGRTVAIMEMANGERYAANAGKGFTGEQLKVLKKHGIATIDFREGVHAEIQLLDFVDSTQNSLFSLAHKALGCHDRYVQRLVGQLLRQRVVQFLPVFLMLFGDWLDYG